MNNQDSSGQFWDIALDVVFTVGSLIAVAKNPTDLKAWAALGADLICTAIPFATGGGVAVRAASKVDNVVDAGRSMNKADNTVVLGTEFVNGKGFDSFGQLKKYIGAPGTGNEWHHIVEQCQIRKSGFGVSMIQNTANVLPIDKANHRAISGYYSSIQPFTEGKTVRNWLAGQSFSAQYEFGVDVIKLFK